MQCVITLGAALQCGWEGGGGKIASVAAALGKLCSVGIEAVNWWRKLMDSGGVLLAPLFAKMIIVCLT